MGKKTKKFAGRSRLREVWKSINANAALITALISIVAVIISIRALVTANTGLVATTRPYLSAESITQETIDDSHIRILIRVRNYGRLPASVREGKLLLDGEQWVDIIETPEVTHTSEDGVTITASGMVMWPGSPPEEALPQDIVFYPDKESILVVRVLKDKWDRSIKAGSVIEVRLEYAWGRHDYWYMATSMVAANGEWNISLERGN